MDREDIMLLLNQGDQFISVGDVTAARVLFERAAEAGDRRAALALGATYDPAVLAKLGVRGIAPDIEKARQWYQKASEFGPPEAPPWLAKLSDR
jgi:TPR repeat protein